jgi:hypothetical protein
MRLRDEVEAVLLAWDRHERERGAPPVVDYDCRPDRDGEVKAADRLTTFEALTALRQRARQDENGRLDQAVDAHLAHLRVLLGEQVPLTEHVAATQGCPAAGWPPEQVDGLGGVARRELERAGIAWGPELRDQLEAVEQPLPDDQVADAVLEAVDEFAPAVRALTGAEAEYDLTVETVRADAYWKCWLDGHGRSVRLRLNTRHGAFTRVDARRYALHEILGHALQSVSWTERCEHEDVPWVRLLAVHAPQQVLLEGLAQALPLFVAGDDEGLVRRTRLDHYTQLAAAELHLALGAGASVATCVAHARRRLPWWDAERIADCLHDRGTNPQLRSYLWAYAAGIDWFIALADHPGAPVKEVFGAVYRDPLAPPELAALWPAGPVLGGPGGAVRLR